MLVPQFRHEADWVEACVLSQSVGYELQGLTELSYTVGVVSIDLSCMGL